MDIKIKEKEIKKYFGLLAECKNRVELLEGLKDDEVYFKENDAIKIVKRKELLEQTKEDIIELEFLIYAKLCQNENKK